MNDGPEATSAEAGRLSRTVASYDDVAAARAAVRAAAARCLVEPLDAVVAGLAAGLLADRLRTTGGGILSAEILPDGMNCTVTLAVQPPLPASGEAELAGTLGDLGFATGSGETSAVFRAATLPAFAVSAAGADDPGNELDESLLLLQQLRWRDEQIRAVATELEDTNRGVLALISEIEESAATVRRRAEVQQSFVTHVSHEFRSPLAAIRGLARLLLDRVDGDLTEEQERQLTLIQQSAVELSTLVDDLLDLMRSRMGATPVHVSSFSLASLIGGVRGVARQLDRVRDVQLVVEDAPEAAMTSDEGKVSQILRNLASNALKFTEHGEVRIRTSVEGARVRFVVQDTGIGIESRHLPYLFDEFYQIDSPIQRSHRGSGLGLPLSQRLANQLGGSIEVESEPGAGSAFTAVLPLLYTPPDESGD